MCDENCHARIGAFERPGLSEQSYQRQGVNPVVRVAFLLSDDAIDFPEK
jgi:hypothetical protein